MTLTCIAATIDAESPHPRLLSAWGGLAAESVYAAQIIFKQIFDEFYMWVKFELNLEFAINSGQK